MSRSRSRGIGLFDDCSCMASVSLNPSGCSNCFGGAKREVQNTSFSTLLRGSRKNRPSQRNRGMNATHIYEFIMHHSLRPALARGSAQVRRYASFTEICLRPDRARALPPLSQLLYCDHCADPGVLSRVAANEAMEREGFISIRQLLPLLHAAFPMVGE